MKTEAVYKFRAEIPFDVEQAMAILPDGVEVTQFSQVTEPQFPDPTVTIGLTGIDLNGVRRWLAQVRDGHVMYETVALEEDYTGDRKYKYVEEIIASDPTQSLEEKREPASDLRQ